MSKEKDNSDLETLKSFIDTVDKTLATGGWQETFLLQNMEKKIKELREEAITLQNQIKTENQAKSMGVTKTQLDDLQTVFVSVFQQDYNDLRSWERTLKSITDYSITRPVYKEEEHIKEMIRGRPDPNKEGYVVVLVKRQDIVKGLPGKPAIDKLGYELLNIKEGGIKPGGIQRFILSGRTYEYVEGSLKLIQTDLPPK
ncbi:MAG: Dot/Icm secretion system protein IcmQ [Gammaproteobacteria bacterium]|nr:Dot/Icm secretion system protein IcmQ [Gammaproteobacteria bacterium]